MKRFTKVTSIVMIPCLLLGILFVFAGCGCEHTWNNPTCTAGGQIQYTCLSCGETKLSTTDDENAHQYVFESKVYPTCTTEGYSLQRCSRCGAESKTNVTPTNNKNHSYSLTTINPTCTQDGYTTYTCKLCNYSYNGSTVEAKGHNYVETKQEGTCQQKSYTESKCSTCGSSTKKEGDYGLHSGLSVCSVCSQNFFNAFVNYIIENGIVNSDGDYYISTTGYTDNSYMKFTYDPSEPTKITFVFDYQSTMIATFIYSDYRQTNTYLMYYNESTYIGGTYTTITFNDNTILGYSTTNASSSLIYNLRKLASTTLKLGIGNMGLYLGVKLNFMHDNLGFISL